MQKLTYQILFTITTLGIILGFLFWYQKPPLNSPPLELISKPTAHSEIPPAPPKFFGLVTTTPDLTLDGTALNVDSPEFFEAGEETLLLVTGKKNDVIEIWQYPFADNELPAIQRDSLPNGLAVDQDQNTLFIGDADKEFVEVRSLPDMKIIREIGRGTIKSGETNLDVLTLPDGRKYIYVTESHRVHAFDLTSGELVHSFAPDVESIEEVSADSYHQTIYVPDENGGASHRHQGGAITAYSPNGKPYLKNGVSVFGQDLFSQDGEGITIYTCRGEAEEDTGRGFIIASDQRNDLNDFEFFDRETWQHLGTLQIQGVSLTDGITATSLPLPKYPRGLFAATNNDKSTVLVSWEKIEKTTGLSCQ